MKKFLALALFASSFSLFAAEVDLSKSMFNWHGKKLTGKHDGTIALKEAKIEEEKGKLKAGEFVMDMASIDVTDLDGDYKQKFQGHIKSPDFFDVEKFPTATLKIKEVKGNKVTADLTIKGKTNPVTFDLKQGKGTYSGVLKFDRTKFDMVYNSKNFFKDIGDKMIYDEVTVDFNVAVK